jgi:taurine dioxygenase
MTSLDIRPISGCIGAEIHGLDLHKPVDQATSRALNQALLDHLVVCFPEQKLTPEEHLAFGKALGDPFLDHPAYLPTLPGRPEVVVLSGEEGGRADVWHSDVTISQTPPAGSILSMQTCPTHGGDTQWSNMYAAYDALSDSMKSYLDGLNAFHDLTQTVNRLIRDRSNMDSPKKLTEGDAAAPDTSALPKAVHPVIRTHPETGRKAIFVNPTFTSHILEVPAPESNAILEFLYTHSVQPEFLCRRRWREGDVGWWDNRCTMHYAIADYGDDVTRVIHRVTLQGDKPV